jgi:RNA polymerase sigma-B factor
MTVTGEIKRHFRDAAWGMHIPRRLRDLRNGLAKTTAALSQQLSRLPTDAEVAASLATPVAEVREARTAAAGYRPISLHQPLRGTNVLLAEAVGVRDAGLETTVDRLSVRDLIARLPSRERHLLALRFHGDLTQAQIAEELGLSQMHVSRLLSRTLTWLREAMLADHLPSWMPASAPYTTRCWPRSGVVGIYASSTYGPSCATCWRSLIFTAGSFPRRDPGATQADRRRVGREPPG